MGYFKDLQVGEIVFFLAVQLDPGTRVQSSNSMATVLHSNRFCTFLYANSVAMEHQRQIIEKWKPFIVET